jgi:hypothetical protein
LSLPLHFEKYILLHTLTFLGRPLPSSTKERKRHVIATNLFCQVVRIYAIWAVFWGDCALDFSNLHIAPISRMSKKIGAKWAHFTFTITMTKQWKWNSWGNLVLKGGFAVFYKLNLYFISLLFNLEIDLEY